MSDVSAIESTVHQLEASALAAGEARVADYFALLKPRVMSLVVFTGFVGMAVAPGHLHPVLAFVALLCIAVGAGASGAINMWYDADIDAEMSRTRGRPIPQGRIQPGEALGFGVSLSIGAVAAMGLLINIVAAALLALTICFYVFVYTIWLKRRTPQNIVIGGAAGAFPPMIGWAAATGQISFASIALFLIIFMWTPPHFWALALYREGEYAKVGVPMLPVVAGKAETRKQILIYSILLIPLTFLPIVFGVGGWLYGSAASLFGGLFLIAAWQVYRNGVSDGPAKRLFGFSILYLFLLFATLLIDAGLRPLVM